MKRIYGLLCFLVFFLVLVGIFMEFLHWSDFILLHPKGWIAKKELELFFVTTGLMLIVVIPVLLMILVFPWKYKEGNPKTKYMPNWENNHLMETIWWAFPCAIVMALSVFTWNSCHELDPFKPLDEKEKHLEIQVVALQWRWLFLYPEHNIAAVNYMQFPEKTPIRFVITADAPMNSFWIPQLGGQIYAMPGMKTLLHLISEKTGVFRGSSANFSGKGFAAMRFSAEATSQEDFTRWVHSMQESPEQLTWEKYEQLVKPSEDSGVQLYSLEEKELYHKILMKYGMDM